MNRPLFLTVAVLAIALATIAMTRMNATAVAAPKGQVLRAQRIELTDDKGTLRAEIKATDTGAQIYLYNAKGRASLVLSSNDSDDGQTHVTLNMLGTEGAVMASTRNGAQIQVSNADGTKAELKPSP